MAKLIGTAGHVDHGKTTLIKALTGIDADRLPEEKKRGMTIDLGFAYIDLPNIGRVSIVDVPGHQKFLTNMLTGALGIDVALLCIACDESVMPQTREHLQILELLTVDKLVVALTKADTADKEMRALAHMDVEELLKNTRFKGAPIYEVSVQTGEGLKDLRETLTKILSVTPPPKEEPWYLPIDRVFSVKGHGVVVTGTLARGIVHEGEEVIIQPGNLRARIRSIQVHDETVKSSEQGKRTALNLSGIKREDLFRGQTVGVPGVLFETQLLDAQVRWIFQPKHGMRVRVSIGSDEAIAKLFLNDHDPNLIQLRFERPVGAILDQPLIIRRYSPPDLMAGGTVVVPIAKVRRKSEAYTTNTIRGHDQETLLALVEKYPLGIETEEISKSLGIPPQKLSKLLEVAKEQGTLYSFAGLWMTPHHFEKSSHAYMTALLELHKKNPAKATLSRELPLAQLSFKWRGKPLDRMIQLMSEKHNLKVSGTEVAHPEFKVELSARQKALLERVCKTLEEAGVNAPNTNEIAQTLSIPVQAAEEILRLGIESRAIIRISEGIYYTTGQIENFKNTAKNLEKGFTAAEFRDTLGTSRKYVIPLLEYFDSIRFTTRRGDLRVVLK